MGEIIDIQSARHQPIIDEICEMLRHMGLQFRPADESFLTIRLLLDSMNGTLKSDEKARIAIALQKTIAGSLGYARIKTVLACLDLIKDLDIPLPLSHEQIWKVVIHDYNTGTFLHDNEEIIQNIHELLAQTGITEMPTYALAQYLETEVFGSPHAKALTDIFNTLRARATEKEKLQLAADNGMIQGATPTRVHRLRALGFEVNLEYLTTDVTPAEMTEEEMRIAFESLRQSTADLPLPQFPDSYLRRKEKIRKNPDSIYRNSLVETGIELNEKVTEQAFQEYFQRVIDPYSPHLDAIASSPEERRKIIEEKWQRILTYMRKNGYTFDMKSFVNDLQKRIIRRELVEWGFDMAKDRLTAAGLWEEPEYIPTIEDVAEAFINLGKSRKSPLPYIDRYKDVPHKEGAEIAIKTLLPLAHNDDQEMQWYIELLAEHVHLDLKEIYRSYLEESLFLYSDPASWIKEQLGTMLTAEEKKALIQNLITKATENGEEEKARRVLWLAKTYGISRSEWREMVQQQGVPREKNPQKIRIFTLFLTTSV